jgi:hypothetical protein
LEALRWEERETLDGSITHHELHEQLHIQEQSRGQTKETGSNALMGIVKDLGLVKVDDCKQEQHTGGVLRTFQMHGSVNQV